jgi:hypothetical protein
MKKFRDEYGPDAVFFSQDYRCTENGFFRFSAEEEVRAYACASRRAHCADTFLKENPEAGDEERMVIRHVKTVEAEEAGRKINIADDMSFAQIVVASGANKRIGMRFPVRSYGYIPVRIR